MGEELHIGNDDLEHIARISHGKDSLKMLDVIITRSLRLDRITSTDVWATDTIRAELPEMVAFKDRADEYIWRKYRIEVEHLCAMRNGEKLTYEKMFYHVPNRKPSSSGGGTVRNKEQSLDSRQNGGRGVNRHSNGELPTRPQGFPAQISPWCRKLKIDYIRIPGVFHPKRPVVSETQNQVFR